MKKLLIVLLGLNAASSVAMQSPSLQGMLGEVLAEEMQWRMMNSFLEAYITPRFRITPDEKIGFDDYKESNLIKYTLSVGKANMFIFDAVEKFGMLQGNETIVALLDKETCDVSRDLDEKERYLLQLEELNRFMNPVPFGFAEDIVYARNLYRAAWATGLIEKIKGALGYTLHTLDGKKYVPLKQRARDFFCQAESISQAERAAIFKYGWSQ